MCVPFHDCLMTCPFGNVQETVHPRIGDAPAVTVTSAWNPPCHELVTVYVARAPDGAGLDALGVGEAETDAEAEAEADAEADAVADAVTEADGLGEAVALRVGDGLVPGRAAR